MSKLVKFIQDLYGTSEVIALHAPQFNGEDKKNVLDSISSTFVSSVGKNVDRFETLICDSTKSTYCVATNTGTSALHLALLLAGVSKGDLVITQSLTFVATCNAVAYLGASPVFVDVDLNSLGMSVHSLNEFLEESAVVNETGQCIHKESGRAIKAVLPMHTFGHPVEIDAIKEACKKWQIPLVEDAAEALGSFYKGKHLGTFGQSAAISFNGNKIITTGSGGAVLCQSESDYSLARHLSTTAKIVNEYEIEHDQIGFNYRLANLNASLGIGQLERLEEYVEAKRALARTYQEFFANTNFQFVSEPLEARSNYWLNSIVCESKASRDEVLGTLNREKIFARSVWKPMHLSVMYNSCLRGDMSNTEFLAERLVNLPSTPILGNNE